MTSTAQEFTVVVTGVGAIIGQGIVKSLRRSGYHIRIVGIDRSDRSPGPFFVDVFEKKPDVDEGSPAYLEYWASLIKTHNIQLILPGLEVDVAFCNLHREFLTRNNAIPAINSPRLIEQTSNKWLFGQALSRMGYPAIPSARPATWTEAMQELGAPPLLLKPLQGNGSRGIVLLHDNLDFEYWRNKVDFDWMLQRIVGTPEEEYTAGVFGLGGGDMIGPLIFRRRLSAAGNTLEAEVVPEHPLLEAAISRLVTHFQPVGPTNFQFRVDREHAYLLEINPRFSSSNSLRTAFGFNEAAMSIDFYFFQRTPAMPSPTRGVAWRYSEDFVIHAGNTV